MAFWMKCALILAGVWIVAAALIFWSRHARPTAQSVTAYVQHADIASQTGRDRTRTIGSVETQLNEISLEDRQQLQRSGVTRQFFLSLTPAERLAFLDATLPAGFKQWMEAFNRMDRAQRRQIVDRTLAEMKAHEGDQPPPGQDSEIAQHFVDQGMRSFYKDADADTKLDLAPLLEQMQKNSQSAGR
jgi:hypothetical protein